MTQSPMLLLGVLMVTGLIFSLLANRLRVPRIAAYALAGLLWSQDLLGAYLQLDVSQWSGQLTDVALAIVAYIIGGSMTITQLKKLGKTIVFCTLGEVLGAIIMVTLAVWLLFGGGTADGFLIAIVLGVLAASTDPAATVAVVHQYRSHGKLTTTLLGIAALDDAIGIILFSVLIVWMTGAQLGGHIVSVSVEIGGAIVLGMVSGYFLALFGHRVRNHNFFLPMVLGGLFLSQGLAELWHVSPLLTAMAMGFTARATFVSGGERLFASVEYLEELVFLIFFTLAGAQFELGIMLQALDLAAIYVIARVIGKVMGAGIGGKLSGASEQISRYVGLGVIPQAGIAIGLALTLMEFPQFERQGVLVLNMILASTIIFELIGPFATRFALGRAGELKPGRAQE